MACRSETLRAPRRAPRVDIAIDSVDCRHRNRSSDSTTAIRTDATDSRERHEAPARRCRAARHAAPLRRTRLARATWRPDPLRLAALLPLAARWPKALQSPNLAQRSRESTARPPRALYSSPCDRRAQVAIPAASPLRRAP